MSNKLPFFFSSRERTGVLITLITLCMFKIIEPSVYRFIQAKYQRSVRCIQTAANEPYLKGRHSIHNRSLAAAEASRNESSPITLTSKTLLGNINCADTNALKNISGIGSVSANRIVKFRSYLGFYVHMDQLKEVYRLPDSVYIKRTKQFTLDLSKVKRISINTSIKEELMRLPYLHAKEWDVVMEERSLKGGFRHQDDLTNLFVKSLNKKVFYSLIFEIVFKRLCLPKPFKA